MIATDNKSATDKQVEVSWFSALCDDDYRFLGVEDAQLKSSWQHCRDITLAADRNGYDNILLPSGYQLGIDSVAFAGGVAAALQQINLLVAVRCGELWVPQLARQMATLQQMLQGRLSINIISSDLPGEQLASQPRYARTRETMQILSELLAGRDIDFQGEFYQLALQAPRITQNDYGCPLFYFGGLSEPARNVAAECADVFLMWPDTLDTVTGILTDMRQRSAGFQRQLRYGYRVHVIVRETEAQAQEAARQLVSRLDSDGGEQIRGKSLDSQSAGVQAQGDLRQRADTDGYVEENLWTGIGRARSGCGAAIVGDPDQVLNKIKQYIALGIDAFILSGYPHQEECDLFAKYVLPNINHGAMVA